LAETERFRWLHLYGEDVCPYVLTHKYTVQLDLKM